MRVKGPDLSWTLMLILVFWVRMLLCFKTLKGLCLYMGMKVQGDLAIPQKLYLELWLMHMNDVIVNDKKTNNNNFYIPLAFLWAKIPITFGFMKIDWESRA